MRTIWVVSDTHFDHPQMVKYCNRPVNFNEIIIERWNKIVKTEDLVIHLGDFAFSNKERTAELAHTLNGHKILTLGNHDERSFSYYLDCGFDFACYQFSIKYFGRKMIFSHTPIVTPAIDEYDLNIHGHLHRGEHHEEYLKNPIYRSNNEKYVLISVEDTFTPTSLASLIGLNKNGIISDKHEDDQIKEKKDDTKDGIGSN